MSYSENAKKLKNEIDENRETVNILVEAGGIRVSEPAQSDKLGYDWVSYYVNDILVRQVYVEQETPYGTADNPIVWYEFMRLIPNAYYVHDGIRKVWMGTDGSNADWNDPAWEVF